MTHDAIHNTLTYLRQCRAARNTGYPVSYTSDPAWLITMAINRRAGWPDDPSHSRGSCMPVQGRYPRKASGDYYRHLVLIASEINRRCIVRRQRLGEHQWLAVRLPHRIDCD